MMNPAACSLDRPGHVEVDPCRRIGTGAIKSQCVTMRPEVMNAALRLIGMLQLFHRHSYAGECSIWKRFYCIFVMFPLITSYRLELRKGKGFNGLSYRVIGFQNFEKSMYD